MDFTQTLQKKKKNCFDCEVCSSCDNIAWESISDAFALLINSPLVQGHCQQQPKTFKSSAFTSKKTAPIKMKSTGKRRRRDTNQRDNRADLNVEESETDLGKPIPSRHITQQKRWPGWLRKHKNKERKRQGFFCFVFLKTTGYQHKVPQCPLGVTQ